MHEASGLAGAARRLPVVLMAVLDIVTWQEVAIKVAADLDAISR